MIKALIMTLTAAPPGVVGGFGVPMVSIGKIALRQERAISILIIIETMLYLAGYLYKRY